MSNAFLRIFLVWARYPCFMLATVFIILLQTSVGLSAADRKPDSINSLQEIIRIALKNNSKNIPKVTHQPPENIIFLVKKYYYQIETQREQLATAKEVQGYFEKGIKKSQEIFESDEGGVSQADITKLKLGLSNTLNNIIDLKHSLQIGKLNLGKLINRDLLDRNHIITADPIPVDFPHTGFDSYLKAKKLTEGSKQLLYEVYLDVESSNAKVKLGIKNRKISRALLVSQVANYDFGIGDSQELFEALMLYTRVFSSYLDSVYTFNVAVAKLEKLTNVIILKN
ncbi:MAG: TolC family protein [Nitrospina sp.]|nr:TolC family protein [Nitrospina sp.]